MGLRNRGSGALRALAIALALGNAAAAATTEHWLFSLRYRSPRARTATVDSLVSYAAEFNSWLASELTARLSLAPGGAESVDYQLETRATLVPGVFTALRLLQVNRPSDAISHTQLSVRLEGELTLFRGTLRLFAGGGWHERFVSLSPSLPIPGFSPVSFRDHDFAVRAGLGSRFAERWNGAVELSTIEQMDVYNLNSPFVETRLEHRPEKANWSVTAMARYRLLLGFGRLAEFSTGVGLRWDLTPPGASGN